MLAHDMTFVKPNVTDSYYKVTITQTAAKYFKSIAALLHLIYVSLPTVTQITCIHYRI